MITTPDNFKMYLSIHEVTKLLSNEQHGMLMKAIQSVQFFEEHIDAIVFDDVMVTLAWSSARVQIKKQIDGFCSKKKLRYDGLFKGATQGATKGVYEGATQQSKPQPKTQSKPKPEPEPQSKPETQVVEISPTLLSGMRVSEYLLKRILANKPNFRKPNLQGWARDIDLAIRIDGRTEQELTGCIDWIYSDSGSFWIPNILSAKKLREKFDTMESQMTSKQRKETTVVDSLYDNGLTAQQAIKQMEMRA